jgi:hypothetical protein
MNSKKRTLPRGTAYEKRALALAERLGINVPPQPLTNAQWVIVWAQIGKALLPIEAPEPPTLQALWADVGMYLAEQNEPEFQWGPGRKLGSKSRKPRVLAVYVSGAAIRKRREREKKRVANVSLERDGKSGAN